MSNLRLQKRLASAVLKCGKHRVWLDPNEVSEISGANSRQSIRRLVNDGLIIRKPVTVHSRFRAREYEEARRKGRHTGYGKRRGTANARMPEKTLWIRRMRVLRNLLRRYRDAKKLDKHLYHELYLRAKGNNFKNKKNLIEYIFKKKTENKRAKQLADQAQARRDKNKESRKRREERQVVKRAELLRKISQSEKIIAGKREKMRIEAHQVFNVSIQLCEFFNVDLSDRGYYQIRLKPKKTAEIGSVDISHDVEADRESGPRASNNILLAHVYQGSAVSKTIEVTYQHEKFDLDDWFHISIQFNSTLNLCEPQKLEIEVELLYMDRYHPPQYESFMKITKRLIEIPLDPTRLVAAARSLYFDSSYLSAITMCVYSSLVMVATRQRRANAAESAPSIKSTKLRRVYNSSAHALLFATRSIQQFIVRNAELINASLSVELSVILDVQNEMKAALLRFDNSENPSNCVENDISEWSTKITLIYQQMLNLFRKSTDLHQQLLLVFDKQRRAVFREAFWVTERPIDKCCIRTPVAVLEHYKSIIKVDYLKKLPRCTIFCEETDCPGEYCPIIFEDVFSRNPDITRLMTTGVQEMGIPNSASLPAVKTQDKHKSFRQKIRNETRKLIHPRRKSLDCSQSLSRKVDSSRSRTKTLAETIASDGGGLLLKTPTDQSPMSSARVPLASEESASCRSEPIVSPSSSSEFGRCSAAGELESPKDTVPLISKESVSSEEVANALRTSVSADEVLAYSAAIPGTSQTGILSQTDDKLTEEHPKDVMAAFELLREREAAKKMLRDQAHYEGHLYSEQTSKPVFGPVFTPIKSSLVIGDAVLRSATKTHLVVFVHGLEGSHEDLVPFRCGLDQAISAYYHSIQTDGDDFEEEPWSFEYLMSSANRSQTWADITTMAHNLLSEVREHVEEARCDIQRISFMAHSLGGVIVRSAIGLAPEVEMQWMVDRCYTLMTINSPHLGLAYVPKHIHWGVQIVKWWKKSRSMEQLSFRDSVDFASSFVYRTSLNSACGKFKNILLVGTPHDQLVPYMSSLLVPSKASSEDQSQFGEAYREMMSACLNSIRDSEKSENLVRYTTFHQLGSTNTQKLTGRAAHVIALEDSVFIEKLFNISAVKYFV
ncbi:hypothetical protein L3Y34_015647 [Caenorhabditis briggsae]|uniref:Ribosomal protein L19 n=1 Tax=Caenorhabditis briggsae TaxID=6238 RepID=A0AAE9DWV6_CAEBR|nr:hypothetical protein L3Y34_015647 [Caenorhabditis briggsae]